VVARCGIDGTTTAALVGTGAPMARPLVHHVRADGSAVLLLPDDAAVLDRIRSARPSGLGAMLELSDLAPVDLRVPVRGLLWITGWLQLLDPASARRLALRVADVQPHPALLQLGHGAVLVRLVPGCAVLSDAEGTAALTPVDLAHAQPDPFCRAEQQWLAHLELAHPEVFDALSRHLGPTLRDMPEARVRPLGVDRCGLRLRVEAPGGQDHDVRLAWPKEASNPEELREQLGRLVGCPFRMTGQSSASGGEGRPDGR
jgi:hypothetical protein